MLPVVNIKRTRKSEHNNPIRIGLVGCGRVAEFGYLPAFRRTTEVTLAALADVNQSRCKEISPEVPAHESIDDLVNAGGVDAVVIATPTRFHLSGVRYAAAAGLPVLVEKPPGLNVSESAALQALKPAPWIGFNRRFEPDIVKLKNTLPRDEKLDLRLALHYRRNAWKSFDMQDDVLLDLGSHLIDLTRWLTESDILWARGRFLHARHVEFEIEVERGHATISCSNHRPYCERVEVKDAMGRVRGSCKRGGLLSGIAARLHPNRESPLVSSIIGQLDAFGRAVRGRLDGSPLATAADGLAVMSAIDAVRRSAVQDGIPIPVQGVGI
jgi:predicted dehydrogenase